MQIPPVTAGRDHGAPWIRKYAGFWNLRVIIRRPRALFSWGVRQGRSAGDRGQPDERPRALRVTRCELDGGVPAGRNPHHGNPFDLQRVQQRRRHVGLSLR